MELEDDKRWIPIPVGPEVVIVFDVTVLLLAGQSKIPYPGEPDVVTVFEEILVLLLPSKR